MIVSWNSKETKMAHFKNIDLLRKEANELLRRMSPREAEAEFARMYPNELGIFMNVVRDFGDGTGSDGIIAHLYGEDRHGY